MDREELRRQSAKRRSAANLSEPKNVVTWQCGFCLRDFVQEKSFMSHQCRVRNRIDELRGPIGASAYAHYSDWMKAKKRSVPPIETFSESQYYSTFVKFAEHAQKTNIPNAQQFIRFMVENNDVNPGLWCRDNVYAMYLQWYDQAYPPESQVLESLEFVKTLAYDYECDLKDVFKSVPIDALVTHIKRRKLSPWFLLSSKVFRAHQGSRSEEEKEKLARAMNSGAMIERIKKNSDLFVFFNKVTDSEGL